MANRSSSSTPQEQPISGSHPSTGLFLRGTVSARTRKFIPARDPKPGQPEQYLLVTYKVITEENVFELTQWDPKEEDILLQGAVINESVVIRSRSNGTGHVLRTAKSASGESF